MTTATSTALCDGPSGNGALCSNAAKVQVRWLAADYRTEAQLCAPCAVDELASWPDSVITERGTLTVTAL